MTAVPDELAPEQAAPAVAGSAALVSDSAPTQAPTQAPPHVSESLPAPPSTGPGPNTLVDAVVVVRNGAAWLAQCLDAIATQTLPPARLVVVDVASTDTSVVIARAHHRVRQAVRDVEVVPLPERVPFGRAVERGVAELSASADQAEAASRWLWVVHDDSAPTPTALARLLQAGLRSPSVGVAGPKLVAWHDPRRLVGLGLQVTRTGRRLGSPAAGEADQGQYDHRTDVLAVSTSGMLVRRSVWDDLRGFDPAFTDQGADLDFGWRAQLAGHRVVVVPRAVVRDAEASASGDRPGAPNAGELERRSRRASRQVTLARCSPLVAPLLALWLAGSAVVGAALLLVAKRPRFAWRELADVSALFHPLATIAARWRGRPTKRLRRSHLATLFVPSVVAARTTWDHFHESVTPARPQVRREATPTSETGPVSEESESLSHLPASLPRRVLTHPGVLAVGAVLVASAVAWRDLIRAGALSSSHPGLAGGELRPVTTGSSGLWHAFRDAWHGAGLGTATDPGPHLAVLSGLTWLAERVPGVADGRSSAGVTIAWLLFLTPALSTWSAYLAGRVVPASRPARAVAALAWGSSAVVLGAVAQGRVTVAVAHVLLPFVLAGYALAARRDGTFTAAFATALATAVVGAFVPPLLALSVVAAAVLLVVGPGLRRARAFVLLVVPSALLGPWVVRFADDWRLLLSGPGLVATGDDAGPWGPLALVLAHPGASTWTAWLAAPAVLLGVLGFAVPARTRGESIGLAAGAALAVVGLVVAVASAHVVLGSAETGIGQSAAAHLWAGVGIQLWLAGVLVGLLAGSRAVVARLRRGVRHREAVLAGGVAVLGAASVLAAATSWAVRGTGDALSVSAATLPAVAVDQATGPLGNRLLLLRPSDSVVDFVLAGQEPGELLRDLDRPADADDAPLVDAVSDLVGGRSADALDAAALARLGIGFVQAAAPADSPLVRRLDAAAGLSRLGTSSHGILWKVRPLAPAGGAEDATAPSRARLVDASGALLAAVPTSGPHAAVEVTLPASPMPRRLVLAEPVEWSDHAVVSFDGRALAAVAAQAQPTYAVPATAGLLRVDLAAAQPWWRFGQAALLGLVVFLALPFGNRRSRKRA